MAIATSISFEGLTYNLDDRDRVAAQAALKAEGISSFPVMATEAITGAGACSITTPVTFLDTTGGAVAVTLAASTVAGAVKWIILVKDGGDATLTIANTASGVGDTVTFAGIGDAITLINAADEDGTIIGWTLLSRESGLANTATNYDGPVITTV